MSERKVQIHAEISESLKRRLDICAVADGVSATALVREALEALLTPERVTVALGNIQYGLAAHRATEREREGSSE